MVISGLREATSKWREKGKGSVKGKERK